MEKMTNIRALPVAKNSVKDSFGGEESNSDTFDLNSVRGGDSLHKINSVSPTEKDSQAKQDLIQPHSVSAANGGEDITNKSGKRISFGTAMSDARVKARNSVFASSGTNILEGKKKLNNSITDL